MDLFDEHDYDSAPRNAHGVKVRRDGKGDGWANGHRDALGNRFYFQDVDALFGAIAFGHNTAEALFMEYVPDDYRQHRRQVIRRFGVVALFDRKATRESAFATGSTVSRALYLWLCRTISDSQGPKPKFFYVIGTDEPPWNMIELDIDTGAEISVTKLATLNKDDWQTVWRQLGLLGLREEIVGWLQRTEPSP